MIKPNFYKDFSCTAEKCNHNCCIGWEIDIDKKTLKRYNKVKGNFGIKLRNSIKDGSFILDKKERCPFLNENSLCEIYKNLGRNSLCSICTHHPRYYNYVGKTKEVGLGFSCEEATRIILNYPGEIKFSKGCYFGRAKRFIKIRNKIFEILKNKSMPLTERLSQIFPFTFYDYKEYGDFLFTLEKLNDEKDKVFSKIYSGNLNDFNIINDEKWQQAFENIIVLFVYRHFCYGSDLGEALNFCCFSLQTIAYIFAQGDKNIKVLENIVRVYSAEIEYSEENTEKIKAYLADKKV